MLILAEVKGQNSCSVSQESIRDTWMQLMSNSPSHMSKPSETSYQVVILSRSLCLSLTHL